MCQAQAWGVRCYTLKVSVWGVRCNTLHVSGLRWSVQHTVCVRSEVFRTTKLLVWKVKTLAFTVPEGCWPTHNVSRRENGMWCKVPIFSIWIMMRKNETLTINFKQVELSSETLYKNGLHEEYIYGYFHIGSELLECDLPTIVLPPLREVCQANYLHSCRRYAKLISST